MRSRQKFSFYKIPDASLSAYGTDSLDAILCALIVDPDKAAYTAKRFGTRLPHSLADFVIVGKENGAEALVLTLHQWAFQIQGEQALMHVMQSLTDWDTGMAAWASAAILKVLSEKFQVLPAIFDAAIEELEDYSIGAKYSMHINAPSLLEAQGERYIKSNAAAAAACYAASYALQGPDSDGFARSSASAVEALYKLAQDSRQRVTREMVRHFLLTMVVAPSLLDYPIQTRM